MVYLVKRKNDLILPALSKCCRAADSARQKSKQGMGIYILSHTLCLTYRWKSHVCLLLNTWWGTPEQGGGVRGPLQARFIHDSPQKDYLFKKNLSDLLLSCFVCLIPNGDTDFLSRTAKQDNEIKQYDKKLKFFGMSNFLMPFNCILVKDLLGCALFRSWCF